MTLGLRQLFVVGALVVFIVSALFAFGVGSVDQLTILGLTDVGLAAWVASGLVP